MADARQQHDRAAAPASVAHHSRRDPRGTTSSASPCTSSHGQVGATKSAGNLSTGGATVTSPAGATRAAIAAATAAPNEKPPR